MREIVRFDTNVPVEVTLRWDHPKRIEGRYGEQMMYTLADDRIMFVPPVAADRIRRLGLRSGDRFEICKAEIREGNRRWIKWQVRSGEPKQRELTEQEEVIDTTAEAVPTAERNGNTNGKQKPFEVTSDGTLLPVAIHAMGSGVMEMMMSAATEVAQRVECHAALRNYKIHFTSEDIRAIGLTMFIQATREGGALWKP
jgi:hypothetical protein